jgi:hypothetical protein
MVTKSAVSSKKNMTTATIPQTIPVLFQTTIVHKMLPGTNRINRFL